MWLSCIGTNHPTPARHCHGPLTRISQSSKLRHVLLLRSHRSRARVGQELASVWHILVVAISRCTIFRVTNFSSDASFFSSKGQNPRCKTTLLFAFNHPVRIEYWAPMALPNGSAPPALCHRFQEVTCHTLELCQCYSGPFQPLCLAHHHHQPTGCWTELSSSIDHELVAPSWYVVLRVVWWTWNSCF